jgi:DNA polymerase III epsilon subunit family exonuclease
VVRPSASALKRLEQLSAQLSIDFSNPGAGIRIGLKNAEPVKPREQHSAVRERNTAPREYFGAARTHGSRDIGGADAMIRSLEYVIVDVETTGGAPSRGHRITEVAAVRMRGDGEIVDEYETLVNPCRYISPFITQLTRITPAMAAAAPLFEDVAENVRSILDGAVFVAHNAAFDSRFIGMELARVGVPMYNRTLCTVRLARRTVTEVQSRSLDSLAYFFGVENQARHRAMGDARATALIFRKLLDRLDDHEVVRWTQLEAFLRRRVRRKRKRIASPQPMEDA